MKNSNEKPVGEALKEMLSEYKLDQKFRIHSILNSWGAIMGPAVANRTTGLEVQDGILIVRLSSSSLRQELFQERDVILRRLNTEAGAEVIRDIIFR